MWRIKLDSVNAAVLSGLPACDGSDVHVLLGKNTAVTPSALFCHSANAFLSMGTEGGEEKNMILLSPHAQLLAQSQLLISLHLSLFPPV